MKTFFPKMKINLSMSPEVLTFKFETFCIVVRIKLKKKILDSVRRKKILIKIIFSQYNVDINVREYDTRRKDKIKILRQHQSSWISVTHFRNDDALR